jgi:hypothetical protein
MDDKPRFVVLVWLHDHWGVTYAHDDFDTCDKVAKSAADKLGTGNAVVVDTIESDY